MKYAITIVSGLAIAAGAEASLTFVQQGGPALVGAGQTLQLFNGPATGSLEVFTFTFGYDEPVADGSWASDMAIDIIDPSGDTVRIGGFSSGLYPPVYDGRASDSPGIYGDSINLAAAGLSGTGTWTVNITNDWLGDPNPNEIGGAGGSGLFGNNPFTGTLGGLTVPAPGAIVLFGVAGLARCRRRRIAPLA